MDRYLNKKKSLSECFDPEAVQGVPQIEVNKYFPLFLVHNLFNCSKMRLEN